MSLPYEDGNKNRFWSQAVKSPLENNQNIAIENLLDFIDEDSVVSSAGSCFAQHIGNNLINRKFSFLLSKFSEDRLESFGLGNIYTTKQLRQWLEFCNRQRDWSEETNYKDEHDRYFDYLIPHRKAVSTIKELEDNRDKIATEFLKNLQKSDVFIFTCGLTETWQTLNEEILAIAPGTSFGLFDPQKHKFINLSFGEVVDDLKEIERLIYFINPEIKFIYTVSPVPLTATAESEHILIANNFSKALLRAAVGTHVKSSKNANYFPSYELITHNTLGDWRFEKNLRSVSDAGVEFVMRHGFNEHGKQKSLKSTKVTTESSQEIYCEEQKLETFNRVQSSNENDSNLFLIGDSHMGKIAEAMKRMNKPFHGGQVMNGSGFSDNKFSLNSEKIFEPAEDEKSMFIWEKTFHALQEHQGDAVIYTNIGFQTHRTISAMMKHFGTLFLSVQNISDYFSEYYTNTLTLLSELCNFGSVSLIEDPCISMFLDQNESPEGLNPKLLRMNFVIYCEFMKKISEVLECKYFSPYHIIFPLIFQEKGELRALLSKDAIHASDAYYQKLALLISADQAT